jgi:hypothetical protein
VARSTRDKGLSDVWHKDRKEKVVLNMSDQFYCVKKGGVHKGDFLKGTGEEEEQIMMEGTKEKGPWYNAFEFSDKQIEKCLANGWIEFMDKKVE